MEIIFGRKEVYLRMTTQPIRYGITRIWKGAEIELGLHGEHMDFVWRPYEERSEAARADYDRLEGSLTANGQLRPVIGWRNPETGSVHILIGQRRAEIIMNRNLANSISVALVREDPRKWTREDHPRIAALRKEIGEVQY